MKSETRRAYLAELLELSARFEDTLAREAIAAALEEVAREYTDDRSGPVIEVAPNNAGLPQYRLTYKTPLSLERALPEWVEMSCVFLPLDKPPAVMTELAMSICGAGVSREIQLSGRVVQQTPKGVAIEVFKPTENQRLQLTRLPDKMREARSANVAPPQAQAQAQASTEQVPELSSASTPAPRAVEPVQAPPAQAPPAQAPSAQAPSAQAPPAQAPPPRATTAVALVALPPMPRQSWRIEDQSMVDLLLEVLAIGGQGVLELCCETSTWQVVLTRGQIIAIHHAPWSDSETLERLLERAGRIEESSLWAVRSLIESEGLSSEQALVKLGFVSRDALPLIAKTRIGFILSRLWSLDQGKAAYYALDQAPEHDPRQGVALLKQLFDRLYDRYCQTALSTLKAQHAQGLQSSQFRFLPRSGVDLDFIKERPEQQRLLTSISGDARAWLDIQRGSKLTEHQTLAFLLTLEALGCMEHVKVVTRTWAQNQRVEQIELLHAGLGRNTFFERLGLHWSAYDEEIEKSYRKLLEKLDVKGLAPADIEALGDKILAVRAGADEAYALLKTRASRVEYRGTKIDSFAQDSAVESFIKQVETAKMRRDIPLALEYCQRILELKPGHAEIRSDFNLLRTLTTSPAP